MKIPKFSVGEEVLVCGVQKCLGKRFIVVDIQEMENWEKSYYPNSNFWYIENDRGIYCKWSDGVLRKITPLDEILK
jgi:hypothetical protein